MGESRNWQTRRLQVPHGAGSNPASPTLSETMPIRSTGRTALSESVNCGSNPRWAATPPRTAAAPLSYRGWPGSAPGGGSPVLVLQPWQRGQPEMLDAAGSNPAERTQPMAREHSQRLPMGDGAAGSPPSLDLRWSCGGRGGQHPGRPAHARLVTAVSTPPRLRWQPGFDSPSRLGVSTCGCSSAWLRALPCHGRGHPFKSGQPLACACGGT